MIKFTMKQLFGNAVYLGNRKMYRSNQMNRFLIGYRNNICLINLSKTVYMLKRALRMFTVVVSKRGHVIFGGAEVEGPFNVTFYSEFYSQYMWYGGSVTNLRRVRHVVYNVAQSKEYRRTPSILVLLGNLINKYFIMNEAICKVIPSIALIDSDMRLELAIYVVPSCNKLASGINFYVNLFKIALTMGYTKELNILKEKLENFKIKRKNLKKKLLKLKKQKVESGKNNLQYNDFNNKNNFNNRNSYRNKNKDKSYFKYNNENHSKNKTSKYKKKI